SARFGWIRLQNVVERALRVGAVVLLEEHLAQRDASVVAIGRVTTFLDRTVEGLERILEELRARCAEIPAGDCDGSEVGGRERGSTAAVVDVDESIELFHCLLAIASLVVQHREVER